MCSVLHCSYFRHPNKPNWHSTQRIALWPRFALEEDSWIRMKGSNYGVYKFPNVKKKSLTKTGLFMNGQDYSDWVKTISSARVLNSTLNQFIVSKQRIKAMLFFTLKPLNCFHQDPANRGCLPHTVAWHLSPRVGAENILLAVRQEQYALAMTKSHTEARL